jgi:hypothetical protein
MLVNACPLQRGPICGAAKMPQASAPAENRSTGVDREGGLRLFTDLSRATVTGGRPVGSNHRFDTRLAWPVRAESLVFFTAGRRKPNPFVPTADHWMLFDKWFEERETQAAESWRIR